MHFPAQRSGPPPAVTNTAEVGVLTASGAESRAVTAALRRMYDYRERHLPHGPLAQEAWLPAPDGKRVRVVAVPGDDPAVLVAQYRPPTILLLRADGTVGPRAGAGDVVVAGRADGDRRLDYFFAVVPATQHRSDGTYFRIHRTPTGSGNGMVTVRGVCGTAGNDLAAGNAAQVMAMLVPFLHFDTGRSHLDGGGGRFDGGGSG